MENREWNEYCRKVFTLLMRQTGRTDFYFPGGVLSECTVISCRSMLEEQYGSISHERLVDFCVCQCFALNGYGDIYRHRWKVNHSFGRKAVKRFLQCHSGKRYYEDRWLADNGLSREALLACISDRRHHPLERFIYPEFEDHTKLRLLSSDCGYIVCGLSTLLWTPFSPACQKCSKSEACRKRTEKYFPELFRLRNERWQRKGEQL